MRRQRADRARLAEPRALTRGVGATPPRHAQAPRVKACIRLASAIPLSWRAVAGEARLWLTSFVRFFLAALRPVRQLNDVAQFFGVPILAAVLFGWLFRTWGWAPAVVFLLGLTLLLVLIEGTRREHHTLALDLTVVAGKPEWFKRHWKVSLKITNNRGDRSFVARCAGPVEGLAHSSETSEIDFPWEGQADPAQLLRRDAPLWLNIGYFEPGHRTVQFALPKTTYGEPHKQSFTAPKQIKGSTVSFLLDLRPADGPGRVLRTVAITLAEGDTAASPPRIDVRPPTTQESPPDAGDREADLGLGEVRGQRYDGK